MTSRSHGLGRGRFVLATAVLVAAIAPAKAHAEGEPAASAGPAGPNAPASAPASVPASASAAAPAAPSAGGAAAPAGDDNPSPAALQYAKVCSGCHSLGEGDRTGPDLLGVTKRRDKAWFKKFVTNPQAVIDSGDAAAKEMVAKFKMTMPAQTLTDAELDGLITYFEECTAKGGCKPSTGKAKKATDATPAEIEAGRELFAGTKALTNGGAPCISCHNVRGVGPLGGGTLAKDLTFVYGRLKDDGLAGALATTPFPLMKEIFAKKPLTPAEQFQLRAFLWSVQRDPTAPQPDWNFAYIGILGLGASLGLIGALWSGRLRHGIRQRIVHPDSQERGEP